MLTENKNIDNHNNSANFFEKSERNSGLHSGGSGVSSRTSNRPGGEAISFNSITRPDGISARLETTGQEKRNPRRGVAMSFIIKNKIVLTYISTMSVIGLWWQLWLK